MGCSYFSGDQLSRILPDTLCGFLFYSQLNLNIVSPIAFTVAVTYDERRDYERDISFQRNVRKCHSVNSIGNICKMSETISFSSHYIHVYFLLSDNNCTCPALAEKCRPPAAAICSVYSLRVFKWCIFSVLDKGE